VAHRWVFKNGQTKPVAISCHSTVRVNSAHIERKPPCLGLGFAISSFKQILPWDISQGKLIALTFLIKTPEDLCLYAYSGRLKTLG